ncbi:carbohydrate esterase family 1 protein [Atractiella rhizophila]|nr:carbohydrate esterase family 1 protein [Atractiella rhizophila]
MATLIGTIMGVTIGINKKDEQMSIEKALSNKTFGGTLSKYILSKSPALGGLPAVFNLFLPAEAESQKVPAIIYLAGLTCNEDTGAHKGGFIRDLAANGFAGIFPDTSPRNANIEGEEDGWDFGTGAGFYLNASVEKWKKNYNMKEYVVDDLIGCLVREGINIDETRISLMGHSMGGHGALTLYLSNPSKFRSASAFAPIANPSNPRCKWGQKAFSGYLEGGAEEGKKYDATELLRGLEKQELRILADVGLADNFYKDDQLLPEEFVKVAKEKGYTDDQIKVNFREGYDHSYYFISTFAPDHVKFHAKYLKA